MSTPLVKRCSKCDVAKELSFFGKDKRKLDGHQSRCKACDVAYMRDWQKANPEKVADRNKNWRNKNPEKVVAYHKKSNAKQRIDNDDKYKIRIQLHTAVRSGQVTRPDFCEGCLASCKPHGHHHDYTKPLDVVWLCQPCHITEHNRLNKLGAEA